MWLTEKEQAVLVSSVSVLLVSVFIFLLGFHNVDNAMNFLNLGNCVDSVSLDAENSYLVSYTYRNTYILGVVMMIVSLPFMIVSAMSIGRFLKR